MIGTCSPTRFDDVRRYGGEPVSYGVGLEGRVREAAPESIVAALDCVGTDEAVDVSLAVVPDAARIVTIAAKQRGAELGIRVIGGDLPDSAAYRDGVRADLVRLAAEGSLEVPVAHTFPLERALDGGGAPRWPPPRRQGGAPPRALRRSRLLHELMAAVVMRRTRVFRALRRSYASSSSCGRVFK